MSISLWFIRKLKRKRKFYEYGSKSRKILYNIVSVIYTLLYYLGFIGFIYNILYAITKFFAWILSSTALGHNIHTILNGWAGSLLNIFFPIFVVGFLFNLACDIWVGDPDFFRTTFKYRIMRL